MVLSVTAATAAAGFAPTDAAATSFGRTTTARVSPSVFSSVEHFKCPRQLRVQLLSTLQGVTLPTGGSAGRQRDDPCVTTDRGYFFENRVEAHLKSNADDASRVLSCRSGTASTAGTTAAAAVDDELLTLLHESAAFAKAAVEGDAGSGRRTTHVLQWKLRQELLTETFIETLLPTASHRQLITFGNSFPDVLKVTAWMSSEGPRVEVTVIDIKCSADIKRSHTHQIAFYAAAIRSLLKADDSPWAMDLSALKARGVRFSVAADGEVWLPHDLAEVEAPSTDTEAAPYRSIAFSIAPAEARVAAFIKKELHDLLLPMASPAPAAVATAFDDPQSWWLRSSCSTCPSLDHCRQQAVVSSSACCSTVVGDDYAERWIAAAPDTLLLSPDPEARRATLQDLVDRRAGGWEPAAKLLALSTEQPTPVAVALTGAMGDRTAQPSDGGASVAVHAACSRLLAARRVTLPAAAATQGARKMPVIIGKKIDKTASAGTAPTYTVIAALEPVDGIPTDVFVGHTNSTDVVTVEAGMLEAAFGKWLAGTSESVKGQNNGGVLPVVWCEAQRELLLEALPNVAAAHGWDESPFHKDNTRFVLNRIVTLRPALTAALVLPCAGTPSLSDCMDCFQQDLFAAALHPAALTTIGSDSPCEVNGFFPSVPSAPAAKAAVFGATKACRLLLRSETAVCDSVALAATDGPRGGPALATLGLFLARLASSVQRAPNVVLRGSADAVSGRPTYASLSQLSVGSFARFLASRTDRRAAAVLTQLRTIVGSNNSELNGAPNDDVLPAVHKFAAQALCDCETATAAVASSAAWRGRAPIAAVFTPVPSDPSMSTKPCLPRFEVQCESAAEAVALVSDLQSHAQFASIADLDSALAAIEVAANGSQKKTANCAATPPSAPCDDRMSQNPTSDETAAEAAPTKNKVRWTYNAKMHYWALPGDDGKEKTKLGGFATAEFSAFGALVAVDAAKRPSLDSFADELFAAEHPSQAKKVLKGTPYEKAGTHFAFVDVAAVEYVDKASAFVLYLAIASAPLWKPGVTLLVAPRYAAINSKKSIAAGSAARKLVEGSLPFDTGLLRAAVNGVWPVSKWDMFDISPPASAACDVRPSSSQKAFAAHVAVSPVTVLWGPPGTGKTFTLSLMVAAAIRRGASVLVAAPTHKALAAVAKALTAVASDIVAAKVAHIVPLSDDLGRGGPGPKRVRTVPANVSGMCVLATAWEAAKFNADDAKSGKREFDVVVLDEASQLLLGTATIPSLATHPIPVGRGHAPESMHDLPRFVIAGDFLQLPPIFPADKEILPHRYLQQRALFGALFEGSVMDAVLFDKLTNARVTPTQFMVDMTRAHSASQATQENDDDCTQGFEVPFKNVTPLTESYRSTPEVVRFVAGLYPFLSAAGATTTSLTAALPRVSFITVLLDAAHCRLPIAEEEAATAARVARDVAARMGSAFVVTPHRRQRLRIGNEVSVLQRQSEAQQASGSAPAAAAAPKQPSVTVDTTERLQGAEAGGVVLAMCDVKTDSAFPVEITRLNVACSRAQRFVCLVTTPQLLEKVGDSAGLALLRRLQRLSTVVRSSDAALALLASEA